MQVVYMGESAYWVNYDVDVPLFLPLYGAARVSDMRRFAFAAQKNPATRIQVQLKSSIKDISSIMNVEIKANMDHQMILGL